MLCLRLGSVIFYLCQPLFIIFKLLLWWYLTNEWVDFILNSMLLWVRFNAFQRCSCYVSVILHMLISLCSVCRSSLSVCNHQLHVVSFSLRCTSCDDVLFSVSQLNPFCFHALSALFMFIWLCVNFYPLVSNCTLYCVSSVNDLFNNFMFFVTFGCFCCRCRYRCFCACCSYVLSWLSLCLVVCYVSFITLCLWSLAVFITLCSSSRN